MCTVIHLVVVCVAVMMVVSGAPSSGQPDGCGERGQRPCPSDSRYCDTWCEYPKDSGRFKCCDLVPDTTPKPKPECPKDPRRPEDCSKPQTFGGRTGTRSSAPPPTRCFSYHDCPSGLGCCYDACLGKTCKHPAQSG
ncbi:unnamed protein product [Meganyctiphanes norvegica]|uniref:Uncharacterized protein n=1 Tax=Meganyctiphanes norvegica TaxID=48144 RepID=A0AAV2RWL2_MEGNR